MLIDVLSNRVPAWLRMLGLVCFVMADHPQLEPIGYFEVPGGYLPVFEVRPGPRQRAAKQVAA
jgi:hypothetical protein